MAAGAWAAGSGMDGLMERVGGLGSSVVWPVRPRKRCIFHFHCPEAADLGVDKQAGLTVDPAQVCRLLFAFSKRQAVF